MYLSRSHKIISVKVIFLLFGILRIIRRKRKEQKFWKSQPSLFESTPRDSSIVTRPRTSKDSLTVFSTDAI